MLLIKLYAIISSMLANEYLLRVVQSDERTKTANFSHISQNGNSHVLYTQ